MPKMLQPSPASTSPESWEASIKKILSLNSCWKLNSLFLGLQPSNQFQWGMLISSWAVDISCWTKDNVHHETKHRQWQMNNITCQSLSLTKTKWCTDYQSYFEYADGKRERQIGSGELLSGNPLFIIFPISVNMYQQCWGHNSAN